MLFLLVVFLATIFTAAFISDRQHKINLCLRWASTGKSYMIQRRTILGAWVPYQKKSFKSVLDAEAFIDEEIIKAREFLSEHFGHEKSANSPTPEELKPE